MTITTAERRKNTRLTQYEGTKQLVLQNSLPEVPTLRKNRTGDNRTLLEFE